MSKYCFGVDVGGTTVKMGLFDLEGNVQEKWEIVTRTEDNGKNILPDVAKSVLDKMTEKNIAKADVVGIGIGVPGPVNDKGVVLKAVNLGWGIMDVNEILGGLTGLAVTDENRNSYKHIISIPESSREEMFELAKKEFLNENGTLNGDTTKRESVYNNLYRKMDKDDRLSAG